jgi:hypothetical protein
MQEYREGSSTCIFAGDSVGLHCHSQKGTGCISEQLQAEGIENVRVFFSKCFDGKVHWLVHMLSSSYLDALCTTEQLH